MPNPTEVFIVYIASAWGDDMRDVQAFPTREAAEHMAAELRNNWSATGGDVVYVESVPFHSAAANQAANQRYETREVLAAAYRGKPPARFVSHTLDTVKGKTLCNRVKPDNLADSHASDIHAVPTCPTCRSRDQRTRGIDQ